MGGLRNSPEKSVGFNIQGCPGPLCNRRWTWIPPPQEIRKQYQSRLPRQKSTMKPEQLTSTTDSRIHL